MPGLVAETVVVFRSPVIRMTVIDQIEYFVGKRLAARQDAKEGRMVLNRLTSTSYRE